jgi:Anti-sigma-K factor rskA
VLSLAAPSGPRPPRVTLLIVVSMRHHRDGGDGDREIAELAALADGSLAPHRRAAVEAQVAGSTELADRLAEQQRAVALAQSAASEVVAPAALRARIEQQQPTRRTRPARRFVVIGAGAAAAVAAAIVFVVAGSGTSAEQLKAALGPTALNPGASGDATLVKTSSGWRITLDATGLPRLDGGRFYEGWLRNRAGVLVPIGTFNEGRNVTLWAGVSPKDFPTLSITRERANGDQASSGQKVLVGIVGAGGSG